MKFAEDLSIDALVDCGAVTFDRDEIIHFARHYDPQPFHLTDEGAADGLFGALTASGVHVATASAERVLAVAMRDVCYLGSPGTTMLRMHRPVYVGTTIRVVHSFKSITVLEEFPGVAIAAGLTQAFDHDDAPLMTLDDICWIGSRRLSVSPDLVSQLAQCAEATPGMLQVPEKVDLMGEATKPLSDDRLYFEDLPEGATFLSGWVEVDAVEIARFHASFDGVAGLPLLPRTAQEASANLANHWLNPGLAIRIMAETIWNRSEIVGGGGLVGARWPAALRPGDRLRARMTVAEARRLRSRPGLGLVAMAGVCVNQRNETVAMVQGMPFIRTRKS